MSLSEKEKCIKKFTPKYLAKTMKLNKEIASFMTKMLRKTIRAKDKTPDQKKLQKQLKKTIEKLQSPKNIEKMRKKSEKEIINAFCNEECKGTVFEKGSPNKLPKEIEEKYKGQDKILGVLKMMRKNMFNGKKDILKDSFYEHLGKKEVDALKKAGAISGCSILALKM
jgi:hypothetical protein